MFSNLASYIFGSSEEEANNEQQQPESPPRSLSRRQTSSSEDGEWVLVGDSSNLHLGSLNDQGSLPPAGSSVSPSEVGDEEAINSDTPRGEGNNIVTRSTRRLATPFSQSTATTLSQIKGVRSAQNAMQKKAHKISSTKNMERKNKAVKTSNCKKQMFKMLPAKSAGMNRQLKQC